ncbi:hypothetical protein U9R90_20950 [Streptomyces sp. E11-3]|uniref:hypothetical protein n=1 Tax=Streptomyces sp. E11-3 TaxID=3110112 RepID=UPI00397F3B62
MAASRFPQRGNLPDERLGLLRGVRQREHNLMSLGWPDSSADELTETDRLSGRAGVEVPVRA